jgi:hypothetical protein
MKAPRQPVCAVDRGPVACPHDLHPAPDETPAAHGAAGGKP